MNKLKRLAVRLLLLGLAGGLLATFSAQSVAALGSTYFDSDTTGECDLYNAGATAPICGAGLAVRLIAGESKSVVKTQTKVRAYFTNIPYTTNAAGTEVVNAAQFPTGQVQVSIYGVNYCPADVSGGNSMVDTARNGHYVNDVAGSTGGVNVDSLSGTAVTQYTVGPYTRYGYEYPSTSANCSAVRTLNIGAAALQPAEGLTGIFYVDINADHVNQYGPNNDTACANSKAQTDGTTACDGILNSFTLRETGSPTYNYYVAQVGIRSGGASGGYATTIREQTTSAVANGSFAVRFGSDCSVTGANQVAVLRFFDLDFNAQTQGQIHLYLKRIQNGTSTWWQRDGTNDGTGGAGDWGATRHAYDPGSNDGGVTEWHFRASPDDKFELYIGNVDNILVQQFTTPFDGIYYERSCDRATVSPSLTITPNGAASIQPGGSATITSRAHNGGQTAGSINSGVVNAWYSNTNSTCTTSATKTCQVSAGAGDQAIFNGHQKVTGTTAMPSGSTKNLGTDTAAAVPTGFQYICASLTLGTGDPDSTTLEGNPAVVCQLIGAASGAGDEQKPYVQVYGGDAAAGFSPQADNDECYTNTSAGFYSWNQGSSGGFAGAGDQFAVQALGAIDNFASSLGATGSSPPTGLSFANTVNNDVAGGLFGGQFGNSPTLSCNYTTDSASATQTLTANTVIGSQNLASAADSKYIIVKNADIYIDGTAAPNGIVYSSSGSWTINNIPSYKLVVENGSIYVGANVTTLSGSYIAEPGSRSGSGIIYTCATNTGGTYKAYDISLSTYPSACAQQLTVYGAFVAKQVRLLRTYGSLEQAVAGDNYSSSSAAEEFIYSPELWLNAKSGIPQGDSSITGLPPVL